MEHAVSVEGVIQHCLCDSRELDFVTQEFTFAVFVYS